MKVVLLERVDNLGKMGDVVTVKPGFGRNFLLPNEKALRATPANLARFEAEREAIEARNAAQAEKAREEGGHLDGKAYVVIRNAGETGQLYGSVTGRDVAEVIGKPIERRMVVLEQPIKALGLSEVKIKLHADVTVTVTINVARTEDEAVRQAAGEDVIQTQMDADRELAEEANAERAEIAAELFDEDFRPDDLGADEAADDTQTDSSEEE